MSRPILTYLLFLTVTLQFGLVHSLIRGRNMLKTRNENLILHEHKPVVIVGLNPALQRSLSFTSSLNVGGVNRASDVAIGIGGKGQNALVASRCMDLQHPSYLLQFLGSGAEGDTLSKLLAVDPILTIRVKAPTRICTTLVDTSSNGLATEIVEPSGSVSDEDIRELLQAVHSFRNDWAGQDVKITSGINFALMGSVPPGCPSDVYAQIVDAGCTLESKVVLDSTVGVLPVLRSCCSKDSSSRCSVMLKINREELLKMCPVRAESQNQLKDAIYKLRDMVAAEQRQTRQSDTSSAGDDSAFFFGNMFVAITDGPNPAYFVSMHDLNVLYRIDLPSMSDLNIKILNPIGAGDAVASGTVHCWAGAVSGVTSNPSIEALNLLQAAAAATALPTALTAFAWGVSCGTASCSSNSNSVFDSAISRLVFESLKVSTCRE